jgi:uncharacterized protein (DUF2147 family)
MRFSALPAIIALASFHTPGAASALERRDIEGFWQHPDSGSLIQIYSCDGGICARVVSTPEPNLKDVKNPDPSLRGRPVAGLVLWRHPKESGDFQWIGTSYNIADGGTYYGTMHLTGPSTLALSVCNLSVIHCADQTWTKAAPQAVPANFSPSSQSGAVHTAAPVTPAAAPVRMAAPVQAAAPAAAVRAGPKPAAVMPKLPPARAPQGMTEEKPKEAPEKPRDPNGYEDLPHIHVR